MEQEKNRTEQTWKFLKWMQLHPGWWYLICTPDEEHMSPQMMKTLVEQLSKESFYEIIFVMLKVHRNAPFMEQFAEEMLMNTITENWKDKKEKIIKRVINYLE